MSTMPAPQLLDALTWRYATKAFDAHKTIPTDVWTTLEQTLVLTPSSYGLQPWKFLVITDRTPREALVPHAWNQRQVVDSSHLVVFCVKKQMSEADVDKFIARIVEVRGGTADSMAAYKKMMVGDVVTGARSKVATEWAARQAYIALGQFMASAALLGVDTCPMEGFLPAKFDEVLGLEQHGLTAAVLCPAGYRSQEDRYASLPKVRFAAQDVIEHR
ncbi:MAG: NAD(P)H-dependent oxidoreductase [Roseimicrobium sp.]